MTLTTDTTKILTILAEVIIADGHILDTELVAMIKCVKSIELTDIGGAPLAEEAIRLWFERFLFERAKTDSHEPSDITLTKLILSLSDWPQKQSVVDALTKISLSDGDFHKEEKLLISIVKAYWQYDGLEAPGSTIGA